MSEQPLEPSGDDARPQHPTEARPLEKRFRRTALSTGFSDVPGKTCAVCGFQGFKWQTTCPQGHPLT